MHGVNINTCIRLCTTADAYALSTWTRTLVVPSTFTRVSIFFGISTNRYYVSSLVSLPSTLRLRLVGLSFFEIHA